MRLVDADALQLKVNLRGTNKFGMLDENIREFIDNAPTVDAVVVTRCKGCKYLVNATVNANGFLICNINDMEIAPNDFCSYGEPKEVTHADHHD